jgi:hypothetical protein
MLDHWSCKVGQNCYCTTIAWRLEEEGRGRLIASYCRSRDISQRSSLKHLFLTIAYQFSRIYPSMKDAVRLALQKNPKIMTSRPAVQLSQLVIEPLRALQEAHSVPFVVIVDALDECKDKAEISRIVWLLANILRDSALPLRILLTSRNEAHVEAVLRKPDIDSMISRFDLGDYNAKDDICLFLDEQFSVIRTNRLVAGPWPCDKDFEQLLQMSGGIFLYAVSICQYISDDHHSPVDRLTQLLLGPP